MNLQPVNSQTAQRGVFIAKLTSSEYLNTPAFGK